MDSLRGYLVTFNCARTYIDIDYFASHFFSRSAYTGQATPPDLIVLCLQEIAPIANSFLGGSLLLPYFKRFLEAIKKATGQKYESVSIRNVGMTAIMILARHDVSPLIRLQSHAAVGVGHWQMGNKGAVGARLSIGDSGNAEVTFVSAHLAPMEDAYKRRNQDWQDILAGLIFTSSRSNAVPGGEQQPLLEGETPSSGGNSSADAESSMFIQDVPVFFAGDLNYRTSDVHPPAGGHTDFPQPTEADQSKFDIWHKKDQLNRERERHSTLNHLEELPVNFPPTYKYDIGANQKWPADGAEPSVYKWAKHRYPSWCDRILFSSPLLQKSSPLSASHYDALPLQPTSDHRPVALSFTLDFKSLAQGAAIIPDQEVKVKKNLSWASHRTTARRLEILVGSGAYMTLTWEGNMLLLVSLVGAVGSWLVLSSIIQA